jgi:purine-nucleoside phosphorylase
MDITPLIISKLEFKGIILIDTCGSDYKKVAINEIIRALKAKLNHRALFNRVKDASKDVEVVDKALKSTKKMVD